jgi:hypothetical protein
VGFKGELPKKSLKKIGSLNKMKLGMLFYRFGALGLLFAPGVLLQEPLKTLLAQNHSMLMTYILLYGLPALIGFSMLIMNEEGFRNPPVPMARLLNSLSALTVFWLILWCVMWSSLDAKAGNQADLVVKYLGFISFLGPLVGAGLYGWGWKASDLSLRTLRFLMAIGWNVSFMSMMNLHLDPTMGHLKGPGIGGLLVMTGVYLIMRDLQRN